MEEQILYFGMEGGGERIIRASDDGEIKFIRRFTYMKYDLDDWDSKEEPISSFESYWSKFTGDPKWFRFCPVFIHEDIFTMVLESLQKIDLKSLSESEQSKIHEWVRVLMENKYKTDYEFKRICREHQSRYRFYDLQVWFDRNINVLLDEDGKKGLNFYSGFEIFSSVKKRYPDFRKPLYCNLLRSEHIPFNFFIPLDNDKEFGKKVFNEILGGIIDHITQIIIEYSPQPKQKYLDDNTSFDTYIEYRHIDGSNGILGIEVKYTELSYPLLDKSREQVKMYDLTSLYYTMSIRSGIFQQENLTYLRNDDYRQIWRNHLLGESILIVPESKFRHFHSLNFYPEGNIHIKEVILQYQNFLKDECRDRVQGITYEQFFRICQKHLPNEEFGKWLEYLERRYLTT